MPLTLQIWSPEQPLDASGALPLLDIVADGQGGFTMVESLDYGVRTRAVDALGSASATVNPADLYTGYFEIADLIDQVLHLQNGQVALIQIGGEAAQLSGQRYDTDGYFFRSISLPLPPYGIYEDPAGPSDFFGGSYLFPYSSLNQSSVVLASGNVASVITGARPTVSGTDSDVELLVSKPNNSGYGVGAGPIVISDRGSDQLSGAAVTGFADSSMLALWTETGLDSSGSGIASEIVSAAGVPSGTVVTVNQTTSGSQSDASAATLTDGNAVVLWTDTSGLGGDSSGSSIKGRIVGSNGTAVGSEFLVNLVTAGDQSHAQVVALKFTDQFVAIWEDTSNGDGSTQLRARLFNSDGTAATGELLLTSGASSVDVTSFSAINLGDDRIAVGLQDGTTVDSLVFDPRAAVIKGTPGSIIYGANFFDQNETGTIDGSAGSQQIFGGYGNDTLVGALNNDLLNGGYGFNTADYSSAVNAISALIQGGNGVVYGSTGVDTLASIQNIDGGAGNDQFDLDSAEWVNGGDGFNTVIALSTGETASLGGAQYQHIQQFISNVGNNNVSVAAGDTDVSFIYGSTGDDTLALGAGGGYLFGEGGTNILNGGGATDVFIGGGGTNTMNGGSGANVYYTTAADTIHGAGVFNTDVLLAAGVTLSLGSSGVQEVVLNSGTNSVDMTGSTDFVYLYGGAGNDTLRTGSGGGYLFGEGGTNTLSGGGGTNVFLADGGAGIDTMNGGSGINDYYIDANSTVHGAGTFNAAIELQQNVSLAYGSAQLGTGVQEVVLNGGTNTADFHTAASTVYLYGGAGNDTLFGGTGNDFLYGGTGTNTFTFATGWGQDTIEDWTTGTNSIIDLTALAGSGVHAITDLMQTITAGNDIITSGHTGTNSITLSGVGSALGAGSFHFG